ncbi:GNAT family N-acetyltransferase [Pusillimonas sp. MFBS29]|uniref:GNAT family N-acetyltransferase n=1 Tax=Pusillimonas sp. MFBS29 TaxID=2886690 RepID=UPI001D1238E7|nr:GNAT family N-acetyltransferase [Pusillimonas sp. MFBS29]MCC2596700.1 GNAT family N-acetyltransferase [Pusillimonas sp. MFBS29]
MSNTNLLIRPMQRAELDLLLDWAAQEGWNPGLHDANAFFAADPEGFLIALLNDTPVAAISVVRYDDHYSFLGFYIVSPAYRGRGYGYQIWQAAVARMGQRAIGLDGVPDQQENYRRSGFELAHRNIRYEGRFRNGQWPATHTAGLVPLSAVPFARVTDYDRAFFPATRGVFLRHWINQPDSASFGLCAEDGSLSGWGLIRACRNGWKIGPLFADTPTTAETLFGALAATVTDETPIYLDVPQVNHAAVAMAESRGMTPVFETARMYTRKPGDLALPRTFGITTFELG